MSDGKNGKETWLLGSSHGTLRALHWTLSGSEEAKRHALQRPLLHDADPAKGGAVSMLTLPAVETEDIADSTGQRGGAAASKHGKEMHGKKRRQQRSLLRLQTSKAWQTPLHWLCAHDVLETGTGESLGGWPARPSRPSSGVSALARQIAQQWPAALLMPDILGLWPLSHLEFCDCQTPHSPAHELLLTLLKSLADLECRHPEVLMQLDHEELRSLRCLVQRLQQQHDATGVDATGQELGNDVEVPLLEALRRFLDCVAPSDQPLRMAILEVTEQRKDAQHWQERGKDSQCRLAALRRLGLRHVPGPAAGPSAASVPRVPLAQVVAEWRTQRESYEERLQQLRFELGRIPTGATNVVESTEISAAGTGEVPRAPDIEDLGERISTPSEAELLVAHLRRQRLDSGPLGAPLRAALGAAVERLAVDLYEMESHFIYELVQNADDNSYAHDMPTLPTLKLELHQEMTGNYFMSVNNEVGLTAQDVWAICDVNASSKRGRPGVTGHKGIGWKSCFQVSDCPYMLSGAFTFKFDVKSLGKLGYVTPTWVSSEELASLPQAVWEAYHGGYTVTYLPLRPGTEKSVEMAMAHLEEHLPCLLFLRRLKSLELRGPRNHVHLAVEDGPDESCVVRSSDGEGPEKWGFLPHRHSVWLDDNELVLRLAFPVQEETREKLPTQALYCLVPVRQLGFSFCLEGPFELIASRGDIHEGSRRNQVLCEAIPAAFAGALEAHPSLAPLALAFLGPPGASTFWNTVHASMLQQMKGTACVPLEEGGLEEPDRCLARPSGPAASEASRLVPSSLLWRACGKRWAAATPATSGLTLEELSLQHWRQLLTYRDSTWPKGLCGSWLKQEVDEARGECEQSEVFQPAAPFRCLWTFLGQLLRTAEDPTEVLDELWDCELLPAEEDEPAPLPPKALLLRLSDGVLLDECVPVPTVPVPEHERIPSIPSWARKRLVNAGLLRVLDGAIQEEISVSDDAHFFLTAACVPLTADSLFQQIFDHLVGQDFDSEIWWAILALLQSLFLSEWVPLEGWRSLGEVLWLPQLGGGQGRPRRLVCPSYLGCSVAMPPGFGPTVFGKRSKAICASGTAGLPLGLQFLDTTYLSYGSPLHWEAFFEALGVRPLRLAEVEELVEVPTERPVKSSKLPQVDSSSKSSQLWAQRKVDSMCQSLLGEMLSPIHLKQLKEEEVVIFQEALPEQAATWQLAKDLVSGEWWKVIAEKKLVFAYLTSRLRGSTRWLGHLPVKGGSSRQVREHLLEGSDLARLCGLYLPLAKVPLGPHTAEVKLCLSMLGLVGEATPSNVLRCLHAISNTCQDVALWVALYQRLAAVSMELTLQQLKELKTLIFVPGHGVLSSGSCAWKDSALMHLAQVPSLAAHYERHGLWMEEYFSRILDCDFTFDSSNLLRALRRMVERVNEGDAAVPGKSGLDGMMDMTAEIYVLLQLYLKDHPNEVSMLRRSFRTERLLLLRLVGQDMPKRLLSEEAWWTLEASLQQVESLEALSLSRYYNEDLQSFFLAMGVHMEMTRPLLRSLMQRPAEVTPLCRWSGLNVTDVDDLGLMQTSSHFRPPDWRAPDEDPAQDPAEDPAAAEAPGVASEPDFQPPRREGGPRVPAMRTREELERIEREEEERRNDRNDRNAGSQRARPGDGPNHRMDDLGSRGTNSRVVTEPGSQAPQTSQPSGDEEVHVENTEDSVVDDSLEELQMQLDQLNLESLRRQQESYDLRLRWAQADEDAERYLKILEQFYTADDALRREMEGPSSSS